MDTDTANLPGLDVIQAYPRARSVYAYDQGDDIVGITATQRDDLVAAVKALAQIVDEDTLDDSCLGCGQDFDEGGHCDCNLAFLRAALAPFRRS